MTIVAAMISNNKIHKFNCLPVTAGNTPFGGLREGFGARPAVSKR